MSAVKSAFAALLQLESVRVNDKDAQDPFISGALNRISRITRGSFEIKGHVEIFIVDLEDTRGCALSLFKLSTPTEQLYPYYPSRVKNRSYFRCNLT